MDTLNVSRVYFGAVSGRVASGNVPDFFKNLRNVKALMPNVAGVGWTVFQIPRVPPKKQ
jgi:hypothetical protein